MKLLVKQAHIIDQHSPYNGQTLDIFIENGRITRIGKNLSDESDQVISGNDLHVSPGWVDLFADFADPGYEFRETLESGVAAAAAGGYTDVLVIPNTKPVVDNKAQAEYILHRSSSLPVSVYPIGAISQRTEGKELAEMYDMYNSGVPAFGDGTNSIQSAGLLVKGLQYVKAFEGLVIQVPDDKSINPHGLINEGVISTRLGLPGKPAMAEELIIARDIKLARYTGSRIHFTGISSSKSLEYILRGRESGIDITCSVTPQHLHFTEEDLADYDTNLKSDPPFRSVRDREFLQQGIKEGWIDCIASHHFPHHSDHKVTEFEYARAGMNGLETAYAVLNTTLNSISQLRWVELLSHNPRKILKFNPATIAENNTACLSLFEPGTEIQFLKLQSRSRNNPFIGKKLKGKVVGIINKGKVFLNP